MSKPPAPRPAPVAAPPPAPRAPAAGNDFPSVLERSKGEIAKLLPEGASLDRFVRVALTAYRLNPDLHQCSAVSVLSAVMKACELGLEPGGALKHAWLIPYGRECQFQLSYFGLLELARRSGEFRLIRTHLVFEADKFAYSFEPDLTLAHRPALRDRGREVGAYCFLKFSNGERDLEYMSREDLEHVRQASKAGPVWQKFWGEMARKTVLKRALKRQPLSVELREAIEADNEASGLARPVTAGEGNAAARGPAGLLARLDRPAWPEPEDTPQALPNYEAESQEPPDPADHGGAAEERLPGEDG